MARLPSECYLIQQADGIVRLFEDGFERQIVAFPADDGNCVAEALQHIRESRDLGEEDKAFACFWAGYFHAHANRDPEVARELFITEDESTGIVTVTTTGTEVIRFTAGDANLAAQAQKRIHDCASLSQPERDRAHFWSGFFYGQATQSRNLLCAGGVGRRGGRGSAAGCGSLAGCGGLSPGSGPSRSSRAAAAETSQLASLASLRLPGSCYRLDSSQEN